MSNTGVLRNAIYIKIEMYVYIMTQTDIYVRMYTPDTSRNKQIIYTYWYLIKFKLKKLLWAKYLMTSYIRVLNTKTNTIVKDENWNMARNHWYFKGLIKITKIN